MVLLHFSSFLFCFLAKCTEWEHQCFQGLISTQQTQLFFSLVLNGKNWFAGETLYISRLHNLIV